MNVNINRKTETGIKHKVAETFRQMGLKYQLMILLLPAVGYIIMFHYIPMYGVLMAFQNFQPGLGIAGSPWVGFDHFVRFFNSPQFTRLIANTLTLSLYSLVVGFPFPVILALSLNYLKNERFKKVSQTILYAPHFISVVVIVGMLEVMFSQQTGIVNIVRSMLGMEKVFFMGNPEAIPHLYVWSGIWQTTGWSAIVYMASLSGIDPSLHEAAIMDGANKFQRVWYIDVKCIIPTMVIIFVLNMGSIMSVGFEKVYLMQNSLNLSASEIISTYVYKRGLVESQYSFSAAIGLFNSMINCFMILLFNKLSKIIGAERIL